MNDNVITIKEFSELCLLTEKVVRIWHMGGIGQILPNLLLKTHIDEK